MTTSPKLTYEEVMQNKPSEYTTFIDRIATKDGKIRLTTMLLSITAFIFLYFQLSATVTLSNSLTEILFTASTFEPSFHLFKTDVLLTLASTLLAVTVIFSFLSFLGIEVAEKRTDKWIDDYVIPYQESLPRISTTDILKIEILMEYEKWSDYSDFSADVIIMIDGRFRPLEVELIPDEGYARPTLSYTYISADINPFAVEQFVNARLHMSKSSIRSSIVLST
jgi:hypothetical protein